MNVIVKSIDQINGIVKWAVVILLGMLSVLVFTQVVFRYVIEYGLTWSDEVARYMLVWVTFLGASLGARTKALIGLEVVVNLLRGIPKRMAIEMAMFITVGFLVLVVIYGVKLTFIGYDQFSPALFVRMSWVYTAIPVGGVLMILNILANAIEFWQGGK